MLVTTSSDPGVETRKLAREIAKKFGFLYFSRQGKTVSDVAEKARYEGKQMAIIVNEQLGKPSSFQLVEITPESFSFSRKFNSLESLEKFLGENA